MRAAPSIFATILTCCVVHAQPGAASPTFEAVSVKPAPPPTPAVRNHINTGGPGTADPGRVDWLSVSMLGFLMEAYDLKRYQVSGPDWIATEKFQLTATVPAGATKAQYRLMLQNVLAERFGLKAHFEKREGAVYSVVVGKGGPKLKESAAAPDPKDGNPGPGPQRALKDPDGFPIYPEVRGGAYVGTVNGRTRMRFQQVTMEKLAEILANQLGRPVTDATDLNGKYDFALTYAPGRPASSGNDSPDGSAAAASESTADPDFFGAFQQIGLKLEQKKGMIDTLVIDRLDKVPIEN